MSILDQYEGQAAAAAAPYIAPPKPEPKFNAWGLATAVPRGVAVAGGEVLASGFELAAGLRSNQYDQGGYAREAFQSDFADSLRDTAAGLRPDPATASTAEQVLFGFARGASKVVAGALAAGPVGVVAAGFEEMNTVSADLKAQGIDSATRDKAAAVQGAGLALAALPLVGQTLPQTAALYLAGGPGGFMAQQALTRQILKDANYDQQAQQYDPFDPVGLAVSSLIPAGFAAWGVRGQRIAAKAAADEAFRTGPVPSERTAVAQAVDAVPREAVDAAMVQHLVERRAASNIHTFGTPDSATHEAALSRAEEQIARGERVNVADMLPEPPTSPAARALDVQITQLEAQRAELLPVAGQLADRGDIAPIKRELALLEQNRPDASEAGVKSLAKDIQAADGVSYKQALAEAKRQTAQSVSEFSAKVASLEAAIRRNAEGQQATEALARLDQQIEATKRQRDEAAPFAAFRTAIAEAARQALREPAQPRTEQRAAQAPEAPNPEGSAPARGSAAPAAAPAVPEPRGAADAQAAGVTPGAKAEDTAAVARLAEVQAQHPDLMVQIDGMDKPMRLDEFLSAVKAEADEMKADAPLMEIAASCAILNG